MSYRYLLLPLGFAASLLLTRCEPTDPEGVARDATPPAPEALAAARCGSCHLAPAPQELDKETWQKGVLPEMAARFGLYHYKSRSQYIEAGTGGQIVEAAGIFPLEPTISREDYERIERYYIENAPDTLAVSPPAALPSSTLFEVSALEDRYNPPIGTVLKAFPERDRLIYADAKADYSNLEIRDGNFTLIQRLAVPHPVSDIAYLGDTILATSMGRFTPTDAPSGSIFKIFKTGGDDTYTGFYNVVTGLQRPLSTTPADLNQDGKLDLIVCEFGNYTGNLVWYENRGSRKYDRHVLQARPGAVKSIVRDFDGNGLPDVLALMAQGDEGVDIHYNMGNGAFLTERVLRFPPLYGSVAVHLRDVNGDGFEDLLYVNGDNADHSMVPKPYHGVRIYLNDGENQFAEAYFFPLPGAYDARLADFDRDGDLDMMAIAFFPAYGQNVVYLENVATAPGEFAYRTHSVPGTDVGRWVRMEVHDPDGDGLPDVSLLALTGMPLGRVSDEQQRKWLNSPSVIHLRNTGK